MSYDADDYDGLAGDYCQNCGYDLVTCLCEREEPIWLCRECGRPCPAGSDVHESCAGFRAHIERGGTLD